MSYAPAFQNTTTVTGVVVNCDGAPDVLHQPQIGMHLRASLLLCSVELQ